MCRGRAVNLEFEFIAAHNEYHHQVYDHELSDGMHRVLREIQRGDQNIIVMRLTMNRYY